MNRRDLLRLAATAGLAPALAGLSGCDDDAQTARQGTDDLGPEDDGGLGDGGLGDGETADMAVPDTLPRDDYTGPEGPDFTFSHGVASGDPLPDRVVLWTRVSLLAPIREPTADLLPEAGTEPVRVFWEVARDEAFERRVAAGFTEARPEADFTVKIDPEGLAPGTTYHYRFAALGRTSPVGRTRTAPAGSPDRVRFAVASCASLGQGRLHAYEGIARAEVDAVLHLGDYMYEYGSSAGGGPGGGGTPVYDPPRETVSLEDYRRRYAWYRLIPELQRVHAQHPMVCIWDDHEHANDARRDGAQNHTEATEGPWEARKRVSTQAWHEWLPVRSEADRGRIYRRFAQGDLVDVFMLDTRLVDRDAPSRTPDPEQSLLGPEQEAWLYAGLQGSTATWKLLGQQVMLGDLLLNGARINQDQWDGYTESRRRLLEAVRDGGVTGVVVATGDIHTSWAIDVAFDPIDPAQYDPETGRGTVVCEFVGTSISSRSLPALTPQVAEIIRQANPHFQWFDLVRKGFLVLDFGRDRMRGDWWLYDDIDVPDYPEPQWAAGFGCTPSDPHLVAEDAPPVP